VDPSSRRGGDGRRSVVLSGGSPADNDASYCTEIARRSVARAALHLGMEGMEGEALDVLGSVLLGYMEMVRFMLSRFGGHWGLLAMFCYFVRTLAPMAIPPPPPPRSKPSLTVFRHSFSMRIFRDTPKPRADRMDAKTQSRRWARPYPRTWNYPADHPPTPMPTMPSTPSRNARLRRRCSWDRPIRRRNYLPPRREIRCTPMMAMIAAAHEWRGGNGAGRDWLHSYSVRIGSRYPSRETTTLAPLAGDRRIRRRRGTMAEYRHYYKTMERRSRPLRLGPREGRLSCRVGPIPRLTRPLRPLRWARVSSYRT
jgi:hypothetical protein